VPGSLKRGWAATLGWLSASARPKDMPGWVFVLAVLWAVGLLVVFLTYMHGSDRLGLPHSFGRIPVEAPWVGPVGGLLASLGGIVAHCRSDWDARFDYWHPIKPLMGAASGAVACLLVIVVARTATGSTSTAIDSSALDAAAFIFGYAEASFRQLITAATDVFLRPGKATDQPQHGVGGMPGAPGVGGSATGSTCKPIGRCRCRVARTRRSRAFGDDRLRHGDC